MYTVTSAAPQFLVDDLDATLAFYKDVLGFHVDFVYENFYAGISLGGGTIHLKCAPKLPEERKLRKDNEHLDAYFTVQDIQSLFNEWTSKKVAIARALETRPWGMRDFYVEDPDGYILCFGEPA